MALSLRASFIDDREAYSEEVSNLPLAVRETVTLRKLRSQ